MFWKRKTKVKEDPPTVNSGSEEWPALAFMSPVYYHALPEEEKEQVAKLDEDFCEIHHPEESNLFIRVVLLQQVVGHKEPLNYGLWVSLSEASYKDYQDNFKNSNHEVGYFGWLSSRIPPYENTLAIPCNVYTRTGNDRPEIVPHEDHDHPFVHDYYKGISKQEAERRIQEMMDNIE